VQGAEEAAARVAADPHGRRREQRLHLEVGLRTYRVVERRADAPEGGEEAFTRRDLPRPARSNAEAQTGGERLDAGVSGELVRRLGGEIAIEAEHVACVGRRIRDRPAENGPQRVK